MVSLGVIFGLYSVLALVAGGFALYPLENSAEIFKIHDAGRVRTQALPGSLGALGPEIFAMGLFYCGLTTAVVVAQLMCYFFLDTSGLDWKYTKVNIRFRDFLAFWIVVPSLLPPICKFRHGSKLSCCWELLLPWFPWR